MEKETCLETHGTFGWYHVFLLIAIGLSAGSTNAINVFAISFMGARLAHYCRREDEVGKDTLDTFTSNMSQLFQTSRQCSLDPLSTEDGANVTLVDSANITDDCPYGWVYDTSVRTSSYVSEWDLVCDQAWMTEILLPVCIAGEFFGSLSGGFLANGMGRKGAIALLLSIEILAGVGAAYAVNLSMLVAMRCIVMAVGLAKHSNGYILATEICVSKHRPLATTVHAFCYTCAVAATAGYAYIFRDWRRLQLYIALTGVPLLGVLIILVPESPRWLLWRGRKKAAMSTLRRLAKFNRKPFPPEVEEEEESRDTDVIFDEKTTVQESSQRAWLAIFTNTVTLRSMITVSAGWMTSTMMYYAVSFNLDYLFGDMYTNMCLFGVFEIVAKSTCLLTIKRCGRTITSVGIFIVTLAAGILAMTCMGIGGLDMVITICAIICRSCGSALNYSHYVVVLELFPTSIRGPVMGIASCVCYILGLFAPVLAGSLALLWAPCPYVVFCIMSALSMCAVIFWLPECKGVPLPQSIPELENMGHRTIARRWWKHRAVQHEQTENLELKNGATMEL